jgi:hypothetical protein
MLFTQQITLVRSLHKAGRSPSWTALSAPPFGERFVTAPHG